MSLTQEERKAIIDYRMEKAEATYEEARKVFSLDMYNLTANRLYYSVYYASTALLLHNCLSSHTHRGTMTLFHLHFVKTGMISQQLGGLFRQLYGMRHEGDYEDFIDFSKDMIEPYFPMVVEFINKVKGFLLLSPTIAN